VSADARELTHYEVASGPVRITRFGQVERAEYRVEKLIYESARRLDSGAAVPS
jgi:hypothetical protein